MMTLDVFSEKDTREVVQATTRSEISEEELALIPNNARRVF